MHPIEGVRAPTRKEKVGRADGVRARLSDPDRLGSDMDNSRLAQQIGFIREVDRLKEIFRQTVLINSRRAENDAEHSWHICLMVLVLAEHANVPGLNVLRVLKMLLVHDIVEIDAGDTFAYDTARMADQHAREVKAAERLFGLLPADQAAEFRALWDEFEGRATPEARFAAAVDRFQPMLLNCATEGSAWQRHGVTSDRVIARNRHIADGSEAVWAYAAEMIRDAVAKGHLKA
jgi:putative hydrolases of HD superfamily